MIPDDEPGIPHVRFGPIRWLNDSLRQTVEEAVSKQIGYHWNIVSESDYSEFACHRCAIVSDDSFSVFFKYSQDAFAKEQFGVELAGLQILSDKTGVPTPKPVGIVEVDAGALLIMEALEAIQRGPRQWKQIGAALARIHRVKGSVHGFDSNGFWGPLRQDNTPTSDWATFFRERRLLPLLKTATDSGNIPAPVALKIERLIARLPELCGPEVKPTLLHGDAQRNNFISTVEGAYVIDPAVYYGNPEADLALLDAFQPVPDTVFDGYREHLPIDPGFLERRDLWRIPLYLAAVALEGKVHLNRLAGALERYA